MCVNQLGWFYEYIILWKKYTRCHTECICTSRERTYVRVKYANENVKIASRRSFLFDKWDFYVGRYGGHSPILKETI